MKKSVGRFNSSIPIELSSYIKRNYGKADSFRIKEVLVNAGWDGDLVDQAIAENGKISRHPYLQSSYVTYGVLAVFIIFGLIFVINQDFQETIRGKVIEVFSVNKDVDYDGNGDVDVRDLLLAGASTDVDWVLLRDSMGTVVTSEFVDTAPVVSALTFTDVGHATQLTLTVTDESPVNCAFKVNGDLIDTIPAAGASDEIPPIDNVVIFHNFAPGSSEVVFDCSDGEGTTTITETISVDLPPTRPMADANVMSSAGSYGSNKVNNGRFQRSGAGFSFVPMRSGRVLFANSLCFHTGALVHVVFNKGSEIIGTADVTSNSQGTDFRVSDNAGNNYIELQAGEEYIVKGEWQKDKRICYHNDFEKNFANGFLINDIRVLQFGINKWDDQPGKTLRLSDDQFIYGRVDFEFQPIIDEKGTNPPTVGTAQIGEIDERTIVNFGVNYEDDILVENCRLNLNGRRLEPVVVNSKSGDVVIDHTFESPGTYTVQYECSDGANVGLGEAFTVVVNQVIPPGETNPMRDSGISTGGNGVIRAAQSGGWRFIPNEDIAVGELALGNCGKTHGSSTVNVKISEVATRNTIVQRGFSGNYLSGWRTTEIANPPTLMAGIEYVISAHFDRSGKRCVAYRSLNPGTVIGPIEFKGFVYLGGSGIPTSFQPNYVFGFPDFKAAPIVDDSGPVTIEAKVKETNGLVRPISRITVNTDNTRNANIESATRNDPQQEEHTIASTTLAPENEGRAEDPDRDSTLVTNSEHITVTEPTPGEGQNRGTVNVGVGSGGEPGRNSASTGGFSGSGGGTPP